MICKNLVSTLPTDVNSILNDVMPMTLSNIHALIAIEYGHLHWALRHVEKDYIHSPHSHISSSYYTDSQRYLHRCYVAINIE